MDPRVPLQSPDPNSLESAPSKDRLPRLPETMAVPETAAPVTEFQEFVASSLGRKLPIYGHSLFDRVPTTFAPVDRIPVTDDYLIGPGDEVLIRAWGQIDLDGKLVVDREGEVFLPKVGALAVAGLKYQQLPEFFRTAIGRVFRNFDLTVSLGQLRSIQVFVVGQARHPGNYTVSSLSTLVNALFASGGPSASGSMRRIQLKRNNLVVTEFDFYDLLLKGDKSKDARLLPGDVIYIPPTGPSIAMAGQRECARDLRTAGRDDPGGRGRDGGRACDHRGWTKSGGGTNRKPRYAPRRRISSRSTGLGAALEGWRRGPHLLAFPPLSKCGDAARKRRAPRTRGMA